MKYVCFEDRKTGKQTIVLFDRHINHVDMADAVTRVRLYDERNEWYRGVYPVSAGFVHPDLTCYGRSESLQLNSRPEEDTKLLKEQFK